MNTTLKILITFFLLLFSSIFILTFVTPQSIEKSAESFIKKEIESEVKKIILKEKISEVTNLAFDLGRKMGLETKDEILLKFVAQELPELIEIVVAYKLKKTGNNGFKKFAKIYEQKLSKFKIGEKQLQVLIEEKYDEIKVNLKMDIRIYSGINASLFLMLLLLYVFKSSSTKELVLPSFLLLISTLLSSFIYLFGQDWIYMMVYNNYLGFGYLIYVLLIFLMLLDITYNKGQITWVILKIITNILRGFIGALEAILSGI